MRSLVLNSLTHFPRHSQGRLLVINKHPPGQMIPQPHVLPRPSKQQLENAVRRAQEQVHSQGRSVTVGAVDCALAAAFGLRGSLAELGWQPRDLAPVQVSRKGGDQSATAGGVCG